MNFDVDISEPDDELTRLINGLSGEDSHEFEATLAAQFIATQAFVHVDTKSLKKSGKMDSETDRKKWKGEISYGGTSPGGVNDPVTYAEEERTRKDGPCPGGIHANNTHGEACVGGDHDFLIPAKIRDDMYEDAMLNFLRGRRHGHVKQPTKRG